MANWKSVDLASITGLMEHEGMQSLHLSSLTTQRMYLTGLYLYLS